MIPTEKSGSPEEILEHFGVKGMKWGVRKSKDSSSSGSTGSAPKQGMSTKKKVAIGAGVTTTALGAAFVAYKLRSNHNTKMSIIKENSVRTADRERFIELMMSSKGFGITLDEARRIANQTYPSLL